MKSILQKTVFALAIFGLSATAAYSQASVGHVFSDGNLRYKITSVNPLEVQIGNGTTNSGNGHVDGVNAFGTITIPTTVDFSGYTYDVTAIGQYAFHSCVGLTGDLDVPNSVKTIGNHAFRGCDGLDGNLTIGNSVQAIGNTAFYGCNKLVGNLNIPNSVQTIGASAFEDCISLNGNLTIGNSVKAIGNAAFAYCRDLTGNLDITNSVRTIGNYAFEGCSSLNGNLTIGNSVQAIGNNAFGNCINLTGNLDVPNSVQTIGNNAFEGCSSLNGNLTIGNSVKTIGNYAFAYCIGLTGDLDVPNSVQTIGEAAFEGCTGFNGNLIIPSSVKTIGEAAFGNCIGFRSITSKAAMPPTIAAKTFFKTSANIPVYVPCGSKEDYKIANYWNSLTNIQDTCVKLFTDGGNIMLTPISGNLTLLFPKPMNAAAGAVTLDRRPLTGGYWSTDSTYVIPYSYLDYRTDYTLAIAGFVNVDNAFVYKQSFKFSTVDNTLPTPTINRQVTMLAVEGATTNPPAGTYRIVSGNDFTFTLTASSAGLAPTVYTNRVIEGKPETLSAKSNDDGSHTFVVRQIHQNIEIGVTMSTGNAGIAQLQSLKAYAAKGRLHVAGLTQGKLWSVYDMFGKLAHRAVASDNAADIDLPTMGIYIVVSEGQSVKIRY